ncbi:MAG: hypothetical protein OHK0024_23330 [Thalassobaculales bacterium]
MLDVSRPFDGDLEGRQTDIAFELLRADIVACRLAPGESVSEAALAARYGLGKATIRGALARLGEAGWVRALARRGHVVAPITLRDIGEIFEWRRIVEPAAARLAAGRADAQRLREIDAVCGSGFLAGDAASAATFLQAHRRFHLAVALAGGNRRLIEAFRQVADESERVIHHSGLLHLRGAELAHGHDGLIAALAAGDGDAAAALVEEEIDGLHRLVVETALQTASTLLPAALAEARGAQAAWIDR